MAENIKFYIQETARPTVQGRAIALSQELGGRSSWEWLDFKNQIPDKVDTAIVVGGDGSLRYIAEKMSEKEGTVLAAGGGSEDAFRRSLMNAGSIVRPYMLRSGEPLEIREFRPARANELFFLYSTEFGRAIESFNDKNEGMRRKPVPKKGKMLLAALRTGIEQAGKNKSDPVIEAVFTAPDIRSINFFPQDLYGDKLTRLSVPPMSKLEMAQLSSRIYMGLRRGHIPEDLFQHVEQVDEVVIERSVNKISLTGDVFIPEEHDKLVITRKDTKPIRIAAIVLPPTSIFPLFPAV